MRIFVSSTFLDLQPERDAASEVLRRSSLVPWGMELFESQPFKPLDVALRELTLSDAVVLIVGFKAGSLIPPKPDLTYTAAEFERARQLGRPIFVFIKTEGGVWVNKETEPSLKQALDDFRSEISKSSLTPAYFDSVDALQREVLLAIQQWDGQGRPGARRMFTTPQEFFAQWAPVSGIQKLFDYEQTLYGRDEDIKSLNDFLTDTAKFVGILLGRGGVGKSKLLRDWASSIVGWQVLFVKEGAEWHSESGKELPIGNVIIVADDAHRLEQPDKLLLLVGELRQRQNVKVLLSSRPSGASQIDAVVARRVDALQVQRFRTLEKLSSRNVLALSHDVLGSAHQRYAPTLAGLSQDTPLVTVVGGRLIARGDIPPELLANEEVFRRAVFDKFVDEYEKILPSGSVNWRFLLNVIAAVSPLYPRDDRFFGPAEKLLGRRRDEILSAIDVLERHGLLLRGGRLVRIVPDVLSDHLLEGACLNDAGEPTGYAAAVFTFFRSGFLSNMLRNLAELDWRITHKNPAAKLLTDIWEVLQKEFEAADAHGRSELLESIQPTAIFQPIPTMQLVRFAIEHEAKLLDIYGIQITQERVERELPPILKVLSYHADYTDEAVRLLWKLAKKDERAPNQYPNGAGRILKDLASYSRYKAVQFNERIVDTITALSKLSDAFDGRINPLDIADELLEKEGEFTESEGYTISLGGFELIYSAIAKVRKNALELIEEALDSDKPPIAARAVESLQKVLSGHLPKFGREISATEAVWQNAERMQVLTIIENRVKRGTLVAPFAYLLQTILRRCIPRQGNEELARKIQEVLGLIGESEELTIFEAFSTPAWKLDAECPTIEEADRRHVQLVERAVTLLRKQFKSTKEQIDVLEKMAKDASNYGIGIAESTYSFLDALCHAPEFIDEFASYLLRSENSMLGAFIAVLQRELRRTDTAKYGKLGVEAASHSDPNVANGAATAASYGLGAEPPVPEDAEILSCLTNHSHPVVRKTVCFGIGRLGKFPEYAGIAVKLLLSVEIGNDPKLADELCGAMDYGHMNPEILTAEQVRALLGKMVPVSDLNEYHVGRFLNLVAARYPTELFTFVLQRLEFYRAIKQDGDVKTNYSPVPHQGLGVSFHRLSHTDHYASCLKRTAEILLATTDVTERHWLKELFWLIGALDDTTLSIIDELLHSGDTTAIDTALVILSEGPSEMALSRPYFAVQVVDLCAEHKAELREEAIGLFVGNAHKGSWSSAPGQPPPKFVSLRDRAGQLAQAFEAGSTGKMLFTQLCQSAERAIKDHEIDDADFLFQQS